MYSTIHLATISPQDFDLLDDHETITKLDKAGKEIATRLTNAPYRTLFKLPYPEDFKIDCETTWIQKAQNHRDTLVVSFDASSKFGLVISKQHGVYFVQNKYFSWRRHVQILDLVFRFGPLGPEGTHTLKIETLK